MDFRQLRYFVAVAECGSINAAAARLHVAQSAVSRLLRTLEERVGCELLERSVAGVELTGSGRLLLERARFILQEIESTVDDVSTFDSGMRGTVRMAAIPSIGQAIYVPLVRAFSRQYPQVRLEIGELTPVDVVQRLIGGSLDLGIVTDPPLEHDHLDFTPLLRERFVLVGPPRSRRAEPRGLSMSEVVALSPIMPPGLSRHLKRRYPDLDPRLGIEGSATIAELVRDGLGHAVLPNSALVTARTAFDGLNAVPVTDLSVERKLAMVKGRAPSLALRAFKAALFEQVERGIRDRVFDAP